MTAPSSRPPLAPVSITVPGGRTWAAEITIDGHPIQAWTRSAHLHLDASQLPTLSLDLAVGDLSLTLQAGQVSLDAESAAALQALGWTPPEATP